MCYTDNSLFNFQPAWTAEHTKRGTQKMAVREIDGQLVVTIEVDESGYFDVANAALFIGRTPGYVRTLAKKGTLTFTLDGEGKMTFHRDVLDAYNATPRRGGRKPGEIPYKTLSSTGRRLRSVIRMVEAETDTEGQAGTLSFLQAMLAADIAANAE